MAEDEQTDLEQRLRQACATGALLDLSDTDDKDLPAELLLPDGTLIDGELVALGSAAGGEVADGAASCKTLHFAAKMSKAGLSAR